MSAAVPVDGNPKCTKNHCICNCCNPREGKHCGHCSSDCHDSCG